MTPPMAKPAAARQKLTQMFRASSPDSSSFHPASATSVGAGSTRAGTRPPTQAACQTSRMASGTIHWTRPSARGIRHLRRRGRLSIRLMRSGS